MDRAINKTTGELISAFEVYNNGSYQNLDKGEWIAPTDSITNWEELKVLDIKEIPVHYVSEKRYENNKGTSIFCSPFFAVYPNSPAKTTEESPTHKMLKNFLFNRLRNNDISFVYSRASKKSVYNNTIKLSDLNINWNEYDIEVQINSRNKVIADILLPFRCKDYWLGNGIFLEIQLSPQSDKQTFDRNIGRAIQGYSTAWFWKDDFVFDDNGEVIDLNKKEFILESFSSQLKFNGSKIVRDLKQTIETECRLLDDKRKDILSDINKREIDIKKIADDLMSKEDEIYNNIIERLKPREAQLFNKIEGLESNPIKEVKDKYIEDITQKSNDFFSHYVNLKDNLDTKFDSMMKKLNYPTTLGSCPSETCSGYMVMKKGKFGNFYGCSEYPTCKKIINIIEVKTQ